MKAYSSMSISVSSFWACADGVRLYLQRIMIIDGAMGTVIQQYKLEVRVFSAIRFVCMRSRMP